jgi:hypothetical protein
MQIELGLEGVVTNSMGTAHIVYSVLFVAWPATNMGQHAISLNDGPSGKRSSHGLTVSPSPPRRVWGAARSPHVSEDHVAAGQKTGRTACSFDINQISQPVVFFSHKKTS